MDHTCVINEHRAKFTQVTPVYERVMRKSVALILLKRRVEAHVNSCKAITDVSSKPTWKCEMLAIRDVNCTTCHFVVHCDELVQWFFHDI